MKKSVLLAVIGAGFAAGLGLASQVWPSQSRAARMAEVFYQACLLPAVTKGQPDTVLSSLSRAKDDAGARIWIDPKSASFLRFDDRRCSLSTYAPNALSYPDAEELLAYTTTLVATHFPQLSYDPGAQMGEEALSKGWFIGALGASERWGIAHFAYPVWGESAGSSLMFVAPARPDQLIAPLE